MNHEGPNDHSRQSAPTRRPNAVEPNYADFCRDRGVRWPAGVPRLLSGKIGRALEALVYWPDGDSGKPNSLAHGLSLLAAAVEPPPLNLLPLIPVDTRSIACAVCVTHEAWGDENGSASGPAPCEVVRWHLGAVPPSEQGAVIDSDAGRYLESVAEELASRPRILERVRQVATRYQADFVQKDRRPKSHDLKPIQVACQNVIIGLATVYQDVTFDGLRVEHYLTCEAPHLAANEGDRALLAILLCEAFQCGGTMEIRFGAARQEVGLPPGLMRYARSLSIPIGEDDPSAISPSEARRLFLAVTPMTDDLRARCADAMDRGLIGPERLCYTLMANYWDAHELDYILATSPRAVSILSGGADIVDRSARLAEIEICRAALMVGMLVRRIASQDGAGGGDGGVRVFEDSCAPVQMRVLEEVGAVAISGLPAGAPWLDRGVAPREGCDVLIAVPRGLPIPADLQCVADLATAYPDAIVALLIPADMAALLPPDQTRLLCPDRLAQIDAQVDRRLLSLGLGRT